MIDKALGQLIEVTLIIIFTSYTAFFSYLLLKDRLNKK